MNPDQPSVLSTAGALRSQLNQMASANQALERSTNEKGRSYLAIINQSICRMLRIVDRMELSHLLSEENHPHLHPASIDLTAYLEELAARVEGILAEIGVKLTLSCPQHICFSADPELLRQMLLEMIFHAALAATHIAVRVSVGEGAVSFSVSDDGPADAKDRSAIPQALEDEEERSAIELARRIARLHGGTLVISAEDLKLSLTVSIPGEATRFSGILESPRAPWSSGGFDQALVTMSPLLPARAFLPENLG